MHACMHPCFMNLALLRSIFQQVNCLFVCLFVTDLSLCSVRINCFSYLAILEAWSIKKEIKKIQQIKLQDIYALTKCSRIWLYMGGRKVCSLSFNLDSAELLTSQFGTGYFRINEFKLRSNSFVSS